MVFLKTGLQIRVHRFDSGTRLQGKTRAWADTPGPFLFPGPRSDPLPPSEQPGLRRLVSSAGDAPAGEAPVAQGPRRLGMSVTR